VKDNDLSRVEGIVRDANPLPRADVLIDSEESVAVTLFLREATEMDAPGLLPVPPNEAQLPESEGTMDTLQRIPVQETKRPAPRRTAAIAFAAVILIAAVVGVGSLVIGDGDGDVASSGQAAPPDITFVDPEGQIFTYEATIRQLIEETYAQAEPLLDVDGVAFSVSLEIFGLPIPDYGVGYSTIDVNTVVIAIDPWFHGLSDVLPERLPATVASALYDTARWRAGMRDETFFETMVWAGLADHFAEELVGSQAPWTNAFPATRTEEFMDRARPLFDTRRDGSQNPDLSFAERAAVDTVFDEWFYFGGADVPRWAGQTLGYRLIETYQAENPGQTAADLVNTPASVFRP
jgi:hypothetical protein